MNSARSEAILLAQQYLARQPIYLDTETTGTSPSSEIVEISIVDHQGEILFDSLVKPTQPIPPDATLIHGITNQDVKNEPSWIVLWPQIEMILRDRLIGVYNADFDLRLIRQTHARYRIPWRLPASTQFFCIMKLYAQFYGQWNSPRGNYRWQSLEAAGRQAQIPLPNSHRAKDDTLLARALLHYMAGSSH